ncbi:MAG TPA: DUF4142 domain-containing protein [Usitatibacter sp.]|nr:DUF4142 domain-containing protein [Usitatibacter sp.]
MATTVIVRMALAVLAFAAGTAWAQDALSRAEARFLEKAAEHGLAEVALGRLAQEKAMRDEVRQFADRMVADHSKANESLMEVAAANRVQLPTQLAERDQRELDKLRKLVGPEFDRAYMKRMLDDHRKDVKEFERQAKDAKNEEVRDFAARTLLVLQSHHAAAKGTFDLANAPRRTGDRMAGSSKP